VLLRDYADRWITQRPNLRPRTVELYRSLLANHIVPFLGGVVLGKLPTALVREWRAEMLSKGRSVSAAAKAYRLLRAVLMTATNEDHILPRNPCRIAGAGTEKPEERPVVTISQVYDLAGEMPDRLFALVLLTTPSPASGTARSPRCSGGTWTWRRAPCASGTRSSGDRAGRWWRGRRSPGRVCAR
jgi:hypothetical protein